MIVHLHCFLWHDDALLPAFLHRHSAWADHVHLWSLNPQSAELVAGVSESSTTSVHRYAADGDSVIDAQRQRFDDASKLSRGTADWVVMLHVDEHLHHPDLLGYLRGQRDDGVTAIRAIGHEMTGEHSLVDDGPSQRLQDDLTRGCRSPALDRLVIFSPSALSATHFTPGEHRAWPEGHVVWPESPQLLLLRYQTVDVDNYIAVCRARAADLLPGDRQQHWAAHLEWTEPQLRAHAAALRARARTVPGLGKLAAVPPEDYRKDERTVEKSGLLDVDWYEADYPDIITQQFDALTHYCEYGWREGRRPNIYFDADWYAQQCGLELRWATNPLVHYIEQGERDNVAPSMHFDPKWYRSAYALDAHASPLRHYLQHWSTGTVSPLPSFDVESHLAAHPSLRGSGKDPYLHYLAVTHDAPRQTTVTVDDVAPTDNQNSPQEPMPHWNELLAMVGVPDDGQQTDAMVSLTAVQDIVRQFLPWLPFDESWYLKTNPDVAEAMDEGAFTSAASHFVEHGFFEGRAPSPGIGE